MNSRPLAIVVDDSKPFLMYLSMLLNRMNLEVMTVNAAAEALEVARVTKPQLMTLDMRMPGMDGIEALREIRRDRDLEKLPVIMISSYVDKNRHWEAMSLGCIDILEKPVDLSRLHTAIQRCNLYPEGPRRYLRVAFDTAIRLYCQDREFKVTSASLSERGMFVYMQQPLPTGTSVDVEIPLPSATVLRIGGKVIHHRLQIAASRIVTQGVAIKFDRLTRRDADALTLMVTELLAKGIEPEQDEAAKEAN